MRRLCLLLLLQVGCNFPAQDPATVFIILETPEGGEIEGLEYVSIDVVAIEAILRDDPDDEASERRVDLGADPETINLLGLRNETPSVLGVFQIEPGYLVQLRFMTTGGVVGIGGEEFDPQLPSYPETGLKAILDQPVRLRDRRYAFVKLNFVPDEQIVTPPGQDLLLKPTIPAVKTGREDVGAFVPNEVIAHRSRESSFGDFSAIATDHGASLRVEIGVLGIYQLTDEAELRPFIEALKDEPEIDAVSQNAIHTAAGSQGDPNDPAFDQQWPIPLIEADRAWDLTTGSKSVTVAVIDSGIFPAEDLIPNIALNATCQPFGVCDGGEIPPELPVPPIDADGDGLLTLVDFNSPANLGIVGDCNGDGAITPDEFHFPWNSGNPDCHGLQNGVDDDQLLLGADVRLPFETVDDYWGVDFHSLFGGSIGVFDFPDCTIPSGRPQHGTQVAGVLGAVGNNGIGVAGLAWNVRIIPIKVLDANTCTGDFEAVELGYEYAQKIGADVINFSIAIEGSRTSEEHDELISVYRQVIETGTRQVPVVAGAGNTGQDCDKGTIACMPAEIDSDLMIGVASSTEDDEKASHSNFGSETIDIAAPGLSVPVVDLFTTNSYATGTSIATPHVTGCAALVLARHPGISSSELRFRILDGAEDTLNPGNRVVGDRRLNVFNSVSSP